MERPVGTGPLKFSMGPLGRILARILVAPGVGRAQSAQHSLGKDAPGYIWRYKAAKLLSRQHIVHIWTYGKVVWSQKC